MSEEREGESYQCPHDDDVGSYPAFDEDGNFIRMVPHCNPCGMEW